MMICPASRGRLVHDDTLELEWSHRTVTHSVSQSLGAILFPHPWKGEIVFPVTLEGERSFLEPLWQAFHPLRLIVKFHHIILQLSHPKSVASPIDIRLAILVYKHTRVNAVNALYRLWHRHKGTFWLFGNSHTDGKAFPVALWSRWEIEIISAVLAYAVGSPHAIAVPFHPWHLILRDNNTMVLPVRQIRGREHMIVCHAEPILQMFHRTGNVVRGIDIHLVIENSCSGISGKLPRDNRILRLCHACHCHQKDKRCDVLLHRYADFDCFITKRGLTHDNPLILTN